MFLSFNTTEKVVKIENLQFITPENESLGHPCGFEEAGVKLEFHKLFWSLTVRKPKNNKQDFGVFGFFTLNLTSLLWLAAACGLRLLFNVLLPYRNCSTFVNIFSSLTRGH